ncbi:MAG: glucose-6-phosphate dehydrogenase (NADP(+)), partial [Mesorhizobium sp.]
MSQERSDTLVLFGATGDLAHKKIFPALYAMVAKGTLTEPVIGVAFDDWDVKQLQARAHDGIVKAIGKVDEKIFAKLASLLRYVSGDYRSAATFEKLKSVLGTAQHPLHYLAVPPTMFETVIQGLEQSSAAQGARLMVEKPFGHDLQSARWLNRVLHLVFDEQSIFRIDHYLGKETVQNLMALRFANALYEPLWNSANVDHVQITVAETVGLEDRVTYYDKAGALRDMVQNHMLQLLCLVAMEAPSSMDADAVRDEKLKVLRALKRINGNEAPKHTVRGQYRAGASAGGPVKGYVEELGKNSNTETFVALKAEIG